MVLTITTMSTLVYPNCTETAGAISENLGFQTLLACALHTLSQCSHTHFRTTQFLFSGENTARMYKLYDKGEVAIHRGLKAQGV